MKFKADYYTILFAIIVFFAIILTIPTISRIPLHQDEHQFYLNAFSILKGEPLHNYLHVALTEYILSGFLLTVNLFTSSGVNFPQGEPSAVTFYYGHMLGAILYFLTFILGVIVVQKREKSIQPRTVFFAVLYFGSIGMFERFLRINSDSLTIFLFLNFLIISYWQHLHKPAFIEMFLLNTLFIFLGTFTNLKSLYLFFPLVAINMLAPLLWYEKAKTQTLVLLGDKSLSKIYRLILYVIGTISLVIAFWAIFVPKPFDHIKFWYTLKKTIIHGTQFDFDYPSQSYKSGLMYIYDLIVYQIGITAFLVCLAFLIFFILRNTKTNINAKSAWNWLKTELIKYIQMLSSGNMFAVSELVIFFSLTSYYIGVSMRMVHWSRWGAPIGFLSILLLSSLMEYAYKRCFEENEKTKQTFFMVMLSALVPIWGLRIGLTTDIYKSNYSITESFSLTRKDIIKFLQEKNINPEEATKKATWFTGYTPDVNNMSFEQIVEKDNQDLDYIFWPHWNAGLLYTQANTDKSTHNQRAFVDKYVENIEYRYPTNLSKYLHATKKFAWSTLKVAWIPEADTLVESYYAVLKLKKPHDKIELQYNIKSEDMSHYDSLYSRTFNLYTLNDSYIFPPCYSYPAVRNVSDGSWILRPPPELGPYGKTAGLYCHSIRFRVFPKGIYAIKINGLPENTKNLQKVYYNLGEFEWDPVSKVATFGTTETIITAEFGVATGEKDLPYLNFEVLYRLDQDILKQIDDAKQTTETVQ